MKNICLIVALFVISSCAKHSHYVTGPQGPKGDSGATVVGPQGPQGESGSNGKGCTVEQLVNGALITCGSTTAIVLNGTNGEAGKSCSVTKSGGVATISCTDGTSATVSDGVNGQNGQDSALANAIGIKRVLTPCGNEFDHDEVLLQLTNGKVLAVFDGGPQEDRLAVLVPGTLYITTDRNKNNTCHFRVDTNGDLYGQYVD